MRPLLVGALTTVVTLAIVVGDGSAQQPSPTPSPTTAPEQQVQACNSAIGEPQSQRQHFMIAGIKVHAIGRVANGRISLRIKMRGKAIKRKFSLSLKGNLKHEHLRSPEVTLVKRFRRHVRHHGVQVKWARNVVGHGACLTSDGGVWNFNVYFKWHGGQKTEKAHVFMFFPVRPLHPSSPSAS